MSRFNILLNFCIESFRYSNSIKVKLKVTFQKLTLSKVINSRFFNIYFRYNRLMRIKEMRWDLGSILPSEIRSSLCEPEVNSQNFVLNIVVE